MTSVKAKTVFNEVDTRFSVVEWVKEPCKFSVVPLKDFEKLENEHSDYILEKQYKVRYCGKKYLAKLCIIGIESFCEKELDRLVNYFNNSALKKNISKSSTNATDQLLIDKESEIQIKCHEIESLKRKLEDQERESTDKINKLTNEIEKLKKEKDSSNSLSISDKFALKSIARTILQKLDDEAANDVYESADDESSAMVPLTELYPRVKISNNVIIEAKALINSKKSANRVFRTLIYGLFTDDILANNNESTLSEKYPEKINAIRDFLQDPYPSYGSGYKKPLTEMCSEARARITNENPEISFKNPQPKRFRSSKKKRISEKENVINETEPAKQLNNQENSSALQSASDYSVNNFLCTNNLANNNNSSIDSVFHSSNLNRHNNMQLFESSDLYPNSKAGTYSNDIGRLTNVLSTANRPTNDLFDEDTCQDSPNLLTTSQSFYSL